MMNPIRIFISSVRSEFAKERQALYEYIRGDALLGQFFDPFLFEARPAENSKSQDVFLRAAEDCDIYVGLWGAQYGNAPKGSLIRKAERDVVRKKFSDYEELNPIYLAGYIERVGSGTTDIIKLCEECGLATPVFEDAGDFTVVLKRKNVVESVSLNPTTNPTTNPLAKIQAFLKNGPLSARELMTLMDLNDKKSFRDTYLSKALNHDLIEMTHPENLKHRNQKYRLTEFGEDISHWEVLD